MSDSSTNIASAIDLVLQEVFGFKSFRARQREVCLSAWRGSDVLLVMPTGAGKSLCYQLPTVARQDGRALVISPLIALIEDQVQKLKSLGIAAERIHSGRQRADSQDACRRWREGRLQFLFIAPERLGVPGFLDFLADHKPAVVAVDEAHCISMWGHDFRSDYRQLGDRLSRLKPANIIALTATATPEVQKDIVAQLGMHQPDIFIHGFRRENIAIDVLELTPGARVEAIIDILKDRTRIPCIVYAPTRKLAESAATELSKHYKTGLFHAGLSGMDRQNVQDAFIADQLEVMVATIAFGMGVDKPNVRAVFHLAAPGSVEAYYQEIGRAGRDGAASSAVLMYAPVDRKTHDYFFDLNYPEISLLDKVLDAVAAGSNNRDEVAGRLGLPSDLVRGAIEKLWIHGGLVFDEYGGFSVGPRDWEQSYLRQRRHRKEQVNAIFSFAEHRSCRMLRLIEHFGDKGDSDLACGICDFCRGSKLTCSVSARASKEEIRAQKTLMLALVPYQSKTSSQLFKELFEVPGWDRRRFEGVVWDLDAQGLIFIQTQSFKKDDQVIEYQRIGLTDEGRLHLSRQKLAPGLAVQRQKIDQRIKSGRKKFSGKRRLFHSKDRSC